MHKKGVNILYLDSFLHFKETVSRNTQRKLDSFISEFFFNHHSANSLNHYQHIGNETCLTLTYQSYIFVETH